MENLVNSITQITKEDEFTRMPILKYIEDLHLGKHEIYNHIRKYLLMPEQLFSLGYPEVFCNKVRILNEQFPFTSYPPDYNNNKKAKANYNVCPENILKLRVFEQTCARCATGFFLTSTGYLTNERCYYHYGNLKYQWSECNQNAVFTCCGKSSYSSGCSVGQLHVWDGLEKGLNDNMQGFVRTQPQMYRWAMPGIYALDCEMCYTIKGMELCKVTVVDMEGRLLYNSFVKPEYNVIDFNTRFSGVTERDVAVHGKSLQQVQQDLLTFIYEDTVLVGHSLNNDFRALKIIHRNFVDISMIFPHERGFPYRYSLKKLVWHCLRKQIQSSEYGHDSFEDAVSAMELLWWKFVHDIRKEEP